MYLSILVLTFLSLIIAVFFSKFFGVRGICFLLCASMFFVMVFSLVIFYEIVLCNSVCVISLGKWFNVGFLFNDWCFYFDGLTAIMCVMISVVSFCVHIFSINYMANDFQQEKFMGLLSIFTFFMFILVCSDNLLQLLLGWEGVGICSYLLINFWYMRKNTNDSAMKALIFNRLGDFFLLLLIFFFFFFFKTSDIHLILDNGIVLKNYVIYSNFNFLDLISLCIVIAAMAKSAQLFLTGWLMDAMEGPTPVSALIHAATMVTAGIYLVVRFSNLLINSEASLLVIIISGSLTTFLCSLIGIDSFDIKKIIASSTASQLGYMFYVCGLMEFASSITHLFYHAFFKALLFLSAGLLIHALSDEQDIRKMGGLFFKLPLAFISIFIGSLALIGFPYIGGFYSKDPIIEYSDLLNFFDNIMTLFLSTLGAFNTTFYSVKLINMVFLENFKGSKIIFNKIHKASMFLNIPLLILILFVFFSSFTIDIFLNEANMFWVFEQEILFVFREGENDLDTFLLVFFFIFLGIFSYKNDNFFNFNYNSKTNFELFRIVKNFNYFKWFFDILFIKKISSFYYSLSDFLFLNLDRGLFEKFLILLIVKNSRTFAFIVGKFQTGFIYHYILVQILSLILFLVYFINFFVLIDLLFFIYILFFFILFFNVNNNIFVKKINKNFKNVKGNSNKFYYSSVNSNRVIKKNILISIMFLF